jgi:DNA-binding IclR family transcriptional regulator
MERSQELKSLKRGLRTLILLTNYRTLTISEAARRLGLPRTTAERIMVTLEAENFIARVQNSKRYALAPRVLAVAAGFSAEDRLIHAATPLLFEKTRQIHWPLALATALGEQMSVRITTDAATSLGVHKRHVGSEIAMAQASGGIVHLAFLDPEEREAKIQLLAEAEAPMQPLARDRVRLDALIDRARRDGYSIEPASGPERALSVPVLEGDRIRAVLVMMYMPRGIPRDTLVTRFVPELRGLAEEIEQRAFGPAPGEGSDPRVGSDDESE